MTVTDTAVVVTDCVMTVTDTAFVVTDCVMTVTDTAVVVTDCVMTVTDAREKHAKQQLEHAEGTVHLSLATPSSFIALALV